MTKIHFDRLIDMLGADRYVQSAAIASELS